MCYDLMLTLLPAYFFAVVVSGVDLTGRRAVVVGRSRIVVSVKVLGFFFVALWYMLTILVASKCMMCTTWHAGNIRIPNLYRGP